VHEYTPLQRLVEQAGALCIAHFIHLERKTVGGLSTKKIRFVRLAMTKDARSALITALADPNCTLSSLSTAAECANADMWVDFHWVADNPHLHPELRMLCATVFPDTRLLPRSDVDRPPSPLCKTGRPQ